MSEALEVRAHPGLHEAVLEEVLKRRPPPASVVDLGAGTGALAVRLAEAGYSVAAYDVDPPVAAPTGVQFGRVDLDDASASDFDGRFDIVLAVEVIEHLGAPGRLLSMLGSLVAEGGLAVVSTPNIASPVSRYLFLRTGRFHQFGEPDLEYGHVMPLAEWQVRLFLARGGLEVVGIREVGDVFAYTGGGVRARGLSWALARASGLMRGATSGWSRVFVAQKR